MRDEARVSGSAGAGLEAVITAAAARGLGGLLPAAELGSLARALAADPTIPISRLAALAADGVDIVTGWDEGGTLDSRFADPVWRHNRLFNMLARGYLAGCAAILDIVDGADLDWRTRERLRLPIDNYLAAVAPTNNPLLNPAVWKEALDTGGTSAVRGLRNLVRDLSSESRLPSSTNTSAFTLGENIAATPGKVVRRERLYELIEYLPQTEEVDQVPILLTPSPVNKYYLTDLEPDKSIIAAHLRDGRRVFVPSWVQPNASHADAGFGTYVGSLVEALETVSEITGSPGVHLLGLCGGGQVALAAAGYLAAVDHQDLLATLSIAIAVVDFDEAQQLAFLDERTGRRAVEQARKAGYFRAADTARSFALLRPTDGIWSGVLNGWLLGRRPPELALLYWAYDQTNMTVQFGADMIETSLTNGFARPGGITVLGEAIDLRRITVDTYVLGASTDHISPWRLCYRTLALVSGKTTFVLADGGHAVVISRPPDHARSNHWTGEVTADGPDAWFGRAKRRRGSWWKDWGDWLSQHTPDKVPAPKAAGSDAHPPLGEAPGEYVRVLAV